MKVRGWKKIFHANGNQKKAGVAILISDKIDFKMKNGIPVVAQWLTNLTRNHEIVGLVPGLASGLRIRRCRELWYRLQMWLGSKVAEAMM